MILTYESLTPDTLSHVKFEDPARACRILQSMAGHDIPDDTYDAFLNAITSSLAKCPEPDRAVINLERWGQRVGNRRIAYEELAHNPAAALMLSTVLAASQFFANMLVDNPEYLEILLDPQVRDRKLTPAALLDTVQKRVFISNWPNAQRDALRRYKAPEILRIGVRDLFGFASLQETVSDISSFADVCCKMALAICAAEMGVSDPEFVIVAMGKLGGQELNYASDIDLVFVHGDGDLAWDHIKLAERVRDTLAKVTDAGFIFRVDLRLRPEGRFGPVCRSLESTVAYYESWAEPWEQQAMMKARVVAGSPRLSEKFMQMAQVFVYPHRVTEAFIESIRNNKRRLEEKIARSGEAHINVKEGLGGIRDIEFTVQLMQLTAGGSNPTLRTGSSLSALLRLRDNGLVTETECEFLTESYIFLRTVEHRLQLLEERAVRCLPANLRELEALAKGLGFPDKESFSEHYKLVTNRVNELFKKLFYGSGTGIERQDDLVDAWLDDPLHATLSESFLTYLELKGFRDAPSAIALLRRAIQGTDYGATSPDSRANLLSIAPSLILEAADTADPDSALRGIDLLAQSVPSSAALFRSLRDAPILVQRMLQLSSASPFLWTRLLEHQELLDLLAEGPEYSEPLSLVNPCKVSLQQLANMCIREQFRIGCADIASATPVTSVMSSLTDLADSVLAWAVANAAAELDFSGSFAVMGLGKLGGRELGYGSDLDVCFVASAEDFTSAIAMAKRIMQLLNEYISRCGFKIELDCRLRPDGKKGPLAMDVAGYRQYYHNRAETWERQAATKMRYVAGDLGLARELETEVSAFAFGTLLEPSEVQAIQHMKHRIEQERVRSSRDIKLGPGGLSDVEWLVQLLQLQHGLRNKRVRSTNTLDGLRRLRDDVIIRQDQWDVLHTAYERFTFLRNRQYLKQPSSSNNEIELTSADTTLKLECRKVFESVFFAATH